MATGNPLKNQPTQKRFVLAIDAGHGGKDTGAIGPSGRYEKDVALDTAKKLYALTRQDPNIQSVLVRSTDEFVDLRTRVEKARKVGADLFLSIHADAHETSAAQGASVFTLSEKGATSEAARMVAERENAASMDHSNVQSQSKLLASVLVDLSKNANLEASETAAISIMNALSRSFPIHNPEVQKAGFIVLKSLDVPSVLVELAFISNPTQEARIFDPYHQWQIAKALLKGIQDYVHTGKQSSFSLRHPPKEKTAQKNIISPNQYHRTGTP